MLHVIVYILLLVIPGFSFALAINTKPIAIQSTNLTGFPLDCYEPQFDMMKAPDPRECRELADAIMSFRPWGRPWILSTLNDPIKVDYKLPLGWKAGSCELRIVPINEDTKAVVTDTFSARYLAHQVHRWTNECVLPWPHLGGEGEIGSKKVLGMTISGAKRKVLSTSINDTTFRGVTASGLDIYQFQLQYNAVGSFGPTME